MDESNLEAQVCVNCGKEFMPEVIEAIPVCSSCKQEEQESTRTMTVNQSSEDFDNTKTIQTKNPDPLDSLQLPDPPSTSSDVWYVRKSDGRNFGPFSQEQITLWATQGKILSNEAICEGDPEENPVWVMIRKHPTFAEHFGEENASEDSKETHFPLKDFDESEEQDLSKSFTSEEGKTESKFSKIAAVLEKASERRKPFAETSLFAEERKKRPAIGRDRKPLWIGIAVGVLLLIGGGTLIWYFQGAKAKSWWTARHQERDRVDDYITEYSKVLGPVSGKVEDYYLQGVKDFEGETLEGLASAEKHFQSALVLKANHAGAMAGLAEVFTERASLHENTALFTAAYDLAFKANQLDPKSALAHRAIARLFIRLNNRMSEAKEHLDRALTLAPDDARILSLLGLWTLAKSNPDANEVARLHLQKSLEKLPTLMSAHYFLGLAYLRDYAYQSANREFLVISPNVGSEHSLYASRALLERADLQFQMAQYREAKDLYEQAIAFGPELVAASVQLADLLIHYLNQPKAAQEVLTKTLNIPEVSEIERKQLINLQALAFREEGRLQDARAALLKVLQLDHYHRFARFNYGLIAYELGEKVEALKYFEGLRGWSDGPKLFPYYFALALQGASDRIREALQIEQENVLTHQGLPHYHLAMAKTLLTLGNIQGVEDALWQAGLSDLNYMREHQWRTLYAGGGELSISQSLAEQEALLREDPESVKRLTGYAYLLTLSGKRDLAIKVMEKAYSIDPQDMPVLQLYATLLNQAGRFDRSAELMRSALRFESQNFSILLTLAQSYLSSGKYTLARQHLETILEKQNPPAKAYYLMAKIREGLKEPAEARKLMIEALKREPSLIAAKIYLFHNP